MEFQSPLSEEYPRILIPSPSTVTPNGSGVDLQLERNKLALEAYLIMDQGLDLQGWLEEQLLLRKVGA
ncbi:hypothetical protein BH11VER1_BH11VER1_37570 [soil metagenome]